MSDPNSDERVKLTTAQRALVEELSAALRDALPYVSRYENDNFSNVALDVLTRAYVALDSADRAISQEAPDAAQ